MTRGCNSLKNHWRPCWPDQQESDHLPVQINAILPPFFLVKGALQMHNAPPLKEPM
ncbi:hypothetical protein AERO8C_120491 [Aeromonas veronii]|uniref:Uncharacterized protein n=1 Tax=Aeromonas veronii TaxID=654 RepID=A0A653KRP9_AERVE|nr:hypothetical protein AERO8C_120491 [Aeromonas veronii]